MTNWNPVWKLTIGTTDYTSKTIANISHFSGRNNIYQQPSASTLGIEIVDLNSLSYSFNINDSVTLQVKNASGTFVPLFGGRITDIKTEIKKSNANIQMVHFHLIAMGKLAKMTRSVTDGVLVKAFDGDQIYALLESLFYNSWNEVSAALKWNAYPATETWATAQNVGLGEIDRPGDYELAARASSPSDIYSIASGLATSGLGYLYEDTAGSICYADSTHRAQYFATNGFVTVSANKAIAPGLQTTAKSGDIRNSIKLTYKGGAFVTADDYTSISQYGQMGAVINTSIEKVADATTQANYYLALRAYPEAHLNQITFPITSGELTDTERNNLLGVFMGMPINVTDLPNAIQAGGNFQGFVEGWSWKTTYNGLMLTLFVSPFGYTINAVKWQDVTPTKAWNAVNASLAWINATIVS